MNKRRTKSEMFQYIIFDFIGFSTEIGKAFEMKSIVILLMLVSIAAAYDTPQLVLDKMFENLDPLVSELVIENLIVL